MLEAYSLNVEVAANAAVPFNNVSLEKGCTVKLQSPGTIALNKCGVYMVSCDASAAATSSIQLHKDGVAQPQAQATGDTPSFITLVQVDHNNCGCCCSSPTTLQVLNVGDAVATFTNINVAVTKVC
ncbi:MAG: hypothetical protein IKP50_00065 [Bacilli bacterium]|nr:hypothetical protein [Bacilli bacterium]